MFKIILAIAVLAIASAPVSATESRNAVTCELCTLVLTGAKALLANNQSEAKVLQFIENNLCKHLGSQNATCYNFLETEGLVILQDLSKLSPADVCKKFALCTSTVKYEALKPKNMNKLRSKNGQKQTKNKSLRPDNVKSALTCEICTLVLTGAQSLIANNQSEERVLQFIENNLCKHLGSQNATCVQFLETEGPVIFKDLSTQNASDVCKKLGLCSTFRNVEIQAPRSLNCTICKLVMTSVQNQLKNNVSEAQIIKFIENSICNITGKLSPICKIIIEGFGAQILQMIAADIDPEKVCELIGMCSPPRRIVPVEYVFLAPRNDPIVCTICQYVVEFLDVQLKNNKTDAAIVHALDQVCKIAPSSLRDKCNNLITNYGVYLVQLLIQFADPLKVCQVANLC